MNHPDKFAIIIGSMKSGTTYLYDLIEQHPKLLGCSIKEPQFFSYPPIPNPAWPKGMEYYDSLWPDWDPQKHEFALEASTSYTHLDAYPNAAERIETIKGRAFKFIYIIRNPVKRVESQLSFGTVYRRVRGEYDASYHTELKDAYIDVSKYAYQLDEYVKRFGRESVLILLFEDFVADPQGSVGTVFRFLGLDPFTVDLEQNKNVSSDRAYLPIVYKLRNMIPVTFSFKAVMPKFLLNLLKDDEVANFRLSKEQEQYILEKIRDDVSRLESEYGVDTSRWGLKFDSVNPTSAVSEQ